MDLKVLFPNSLSGLIETIDDIIITTVTLRGPHVIPGRRHGDDRTNGAAAHTRSFPQWMDRCDQLVTDDTDDMNCPLNAQDVAKRQNCR